MSAINEAAKRLVIDLVTTVHKGEVSVAEDSRSHKLIIIGKTPAVEDVVAEDLVHRMALNLEEERIDS